MEQVKVNKRRRQFQGGQGNLTKKFGEIQKKFKKKTKESCRRGGRSKEKEKVL